MYNFIITDVAIAIPASHIATIIKSWEIATCFMIKVYDIILTTHTKYYMHVSNQSYLIW